jgi:hypothetical protein
MHMEVHLACMHPSGYAENRFNPCQNIYAAILNPHKMRDRSRPGEELQRPPHRVLNLQDSIGQFASKFLTDQRLFLGPVFMGITKQ